MWSPELSNKFLGDADAGGPGTTLENHYFRGICLLPDSVSDLGTAKPLNFRDHQTT